MCPIHLADERAAVVRRCRGSCGGCQRVFAWCRCSGRIVKRCSDLEVLHALRSRSTLALGKACLGQQLRRFSLHMKRQYRQIYS